MSGADGQKRELLERDANRTRERLIDTLSALDQRRHNITNVKKQLHDHARPVAIGVSVLLLSVGTALGFSIYHLATRRERIRRERWKALTRLWKHPERLARRNPPKGTLVSDVGRKVVMSALTFLAVELTKRTVRRAIPSGKPEPRPKVVIRTLPA